MDAESVSPLFPVSEGPWHNGPFHNTTEETLISLLGFAFRALCGLPLREYLVQMQAHAVFLQRLLQKAYV